VSLGTPQVKGLIDVASATNIGGEGRWIIVIQAFIIEAGTPALDLTLFASILL
jgi:hypothetical protein